MLESDPVVNEMRRNGAQIAEDCHGDVHKFAERLRREQADHPHRVVRRTPLPPADVSRTPPPSR